MIQEEEARKVIEGIVTEAESETVFVFTDGSCKGNPGPCGAGACRVFPHFCISGVLGTPICCFCESLDKFQESHVKIHSEVL